MCDFTGTYAAVGDNDQNALRLISGNFEQNGVITIALDQLNSAKDNKWSDYFKGMAQVLEANGAKFTHGLDVYIYGNLPNGAGLSSSASLELLAGTILNTAFDAGFEMLDLIKFGQKVENNYIGVNSGSWINSLSAWVKQTGQPLWTPTPWNMNLFRLPWRQCHFDHEHQQAPGIS